MIYVGGMKEAMDHFLYGGGIQTQEFPKCDRCGDEVDETLAVKADGEMYCEYCLNERRKRFYSTLVNDLARYTTGLDRMAMKRAFEDFIEDYLDDGDCLL